VIDSEWEQRMREHSERMKASQTKTAEQAAPKLRKSGFLRRLWLATINASLAFMIVLDGPSAVLPLDQDGNVLLASDDDALEIDGIVIPMKTLVSLMRPDASRFYRFERTAAGIAAYGYSKQEFVDLLVGELMAPAAATQGGSHA
jgi:hypothetical protein